MKHNEFMREAYGDGSTGALRGKLEPPADKAWVESWRKKMKMATVSFKRTANTVVFATEPFLVVCRDNLSV